MGAILLPQTCTFIAKKLHFFEYFLLTLSWAALLLTLEFDLCIDDEHDDLDPKKKKLKTKCKQASNITVG